MWPPLFQVLLDEPILLREHASAYTALIRQDAARWQARLVRRLGFLLLLGTSILLALIFAGIALMLHAVTTGAHWLLWFVPALPLIGATIAAGCLWWGAPVPSAFSRVRAQVAADMQLVDGKAPQS
jgi:hypothetical protein